MNYYRRFPGDYTGDTRHLTMLEHGAYNPLLDHLYATEKPIPSLEAALRICGAATKNERKAVVSVLLQFFYETPEGYRHKRVDEEIKHVESKSQSSKRSAEARWNGKRSQTEGTADAMRSHPERISIPDSRLQTPEKEESKNKAPNTGAVASLPDWLPKKEWADYLKMRQRIRKPATAEAIVLAISELEKLKAAGNDPKLVLEQSILNSWQGLFELRVDYRAAREAERNRDAYAGSHNPNRTVKPPTPEEAAEIEQTRRDNDLWNQLEKGTLPVNAETIAWVKAKADRLRKLKLPAADPRPKWFAAFFARAKVAA